MNIDPASSPADSFGCPLGKLTDDQQIVGSSIRFHKKSSRSPLLAQVATPGANRGHLLGLSMQAGHSRRIFRQHHSLVQRFEENSVYVRNFADAYKADLQGRFQFVLLEISDAALLQIADETDVRGVTELMPRSEEADPVLGGLVAALFSGVDGKHEASALFVDQLSLAIGAHVAHRYGNGRLTSSDRRPALSRRIEMRAKEMIDSRVGGDISLDELAASCDMTRSTFVRAFRHATGKTPNKWLMQQRIAKARALLVSSPLSLSAIAGACGFADQSHFTRVFVAELGVAPGIWRRSRQS
jgi:AraC family transcriptional regulator